MLILEINWYCTATTSATLGLGGVPAGQPSFRDRLANDPEVTAKLSKEDLDHAFDIRHHTRFSGTIIDRALRDKDHEGIRRRHEMVSSDVIKAQLAKTLEGTNFANLGSQYKGKVRDCYTRDGRRIIVVTDRISAFDVVLGTIPFKGQVLNQIAAYWFKATGHLAPNHVIEVPDPTVMLATECTLLPVEFVFRSYLTGVTTTSIWYHYQRGARRFCGHALPDGMKKNQRLEKAILTPSTKAEQSGHDQSVSREEILASGVISAKDFDDAAAMCARVFAFGQEVAAKRGLILVDTKYEIGRRPDGSLCFIDEIHTPDSSRYWYADDYQARFDRGEEPRGLDKEYVRRTLAEGGYLGDGPPPPLSDEVRCEAARRYIALYELVTGQEFVPDTAEPVARIKQKLGI